MPLEVFTAAVYGGAHRSEVRDGFGETMGDRRHSARSAARLGSDECPGSRDRIARHTQPERGPQHVRHRKHRLAGDVGEGDGHNLIGGARRPQW